MTWRSNKRGVPVVRNHIDSGIAACLLMAMCDKEMARSLGITQASVKSLLSNMMRRAGETSRTGLALMLCVEVGGSI